VNGFLRGIYGRYLSIPLQIEDDLARCAAYVKDFELLGARIVLFNELKDKPSLCYSPEMFTVKM
jgi:hypothetical protein